MAIIYQVLRRGDNGVDFVLRKVERGEKDEMEILDMNEERIMTRHGPHIPANAMILGSQPS